MPDRVATLEEAVARAVRPGDTVQVVLGHHRWTAAARELCRQQWGNDLGLTLVMASLGSLGALFFRGGLVRRVVTAYSGDSFPTYTPNPVFQDAYASGAVEVEHWSFLSLVQRLEAAAAGLPAAVTGSLAGSSMAGNDGYATVESPFGEVGLVAPLAPDVALLHAAAATPDGDVAVAPPLLEGVAGALAARRGCVVTVERVVDDLRPWAPFVRIPAHRVLAVVEAPFGAHPGGVYAGALPVDGYGEDIPFWTAAREAARGDFDAFARTWCREPATHDAYLARLGSDRLAGLRRRAAPDSWRDDESAFPVDDLTPASAWETAAALAAREVEDAVARTNADAVLAGAGVANLAGWAAVARARAAGHPVELTAELGLWGYTPTPADPFIFNHRAFPRARALTDATTVLGAVVGGPGTTTVACLGAAQVDSRGDLNSTLVPGGPFLVGSGGGNDVASRADEVVVVTLLRPQRTPDRVGYVTSPGRAVTTVVTDLGVLRRRDGVLRLAAVPEGVDPADAVAACGWPLDVERDVAVLAPVTPSEVTALRRYDPQRLFLADA
jgi:acyl CoA:acetate/3-ketoacid CoA transferase beta subunit/acyl CoA:acetate/3-ketoacid CoA transferase alpha subunit